MVVTEKYCIDQLPMIPFIDYTMIVGVVKTVGVVKCPVIHFQKLGNYEIAYLIDRYHAYVPSALRCGYAHARLGAIDYKTHSKL